MTTKIESTAGNLNLSHTKISSLPENLSVGGDLSLRGTMVNSLPENLSVGGDLNLSYTKISSLPENLSVGGSLYHDGNLDGMRVIKCCGKLNRDVYVFPHKGDVYVTAGCFFDTLEAFNKAVDEKYGDTPQGEEYKRRVNEESKLVK